MNKTMCRISGAFLVLMLTAAIPASAGEKTARFLLTSNLNGRFNVSAKEHDRPDPLLIMAQSLLHEQMTDHADLYLDLGNAFYPGLLSRFSYGSVVMDFLDSLDCAATLVSSMDLNIGVSNLEFLAKEKQARLLSANIEKDGKPLFLPFFIRPINGRRYAFIGLSSETGFIDAAEKKLMDVSLKDYEKVLDQVITEVKNREADYIVLLSGRSYPDNFAIMEKFGRIDLCISGGDATGELYAVKARRVDMGDGRSLVTLTNPDGFYVLNLSAGDQLEVRELKFIPSSPHEIRDDGYLEFVDRLSIWQERFVLEGDVEIIPDNGRAVSMDALRVAQLLRHRYDAEIAIVEKNAISPGRIAGPIMYSNILGMVKNEFPIFTYSVSGADLRQVAGQEPDFVIAGTDGVSVQGYPIDDRRRYKICSAQSVFERVAKRLNKPLSHKNFWRTMADEIKEDLRGERVLGFSDYDYLDRRFRTLVDVSLANFYDHAAVARDDDMDIPPGKPPETYEKWGLEDKIDITVYNLKHKFVFTPYLFYVREDESYFQNLLRGTFFYTYNENPYLKPYHKSQVDTVVKVVDNLRPLLFRETVGALWERGPITGKVGLGIEKQTRDPEKPLFSGIETIVGARYEWREYLKYTFDLDLFYSLERADFNKQQIRTEITNAFSCRVNSFLAVSAKHKWFYFYTREDSDSYRDSQVLLSLDLITDFKIF
ncbi:MAG: hypothetical protein AB1724_07895 [Thermodesulfobacteriota bacterium]